MFFVPRPRTEAAERAFSYGGQSCGMVGKKPLELDCPLLGLRKSQPVSVYFLNVGTIIYTQRNIERILHGRVDIRNFAALRICYSYD